MKKFKSKQKYKLQLLVTESILYMDVRKTMKLFDTSKEKQSFLRSYSVQH
jgi:hypothetical protein